MPTEDLTLSGWGRKHLPADRMGAPVRALIVLPLLLGAALEASAEGVVATGSASGASAYFVTHDHDTRDSARTLALSDCRASAIDCKVVHEFTLTCVGITQPRNAPLQILFDATHEAVNERLPTLCPAGTPCNYHVWCDTRPVAVKVSPPEMVPIVQARYQSQPIDITGYAAVSAVLLLLAYAVYLEFANRGERAAPGKRTLPAAPPPAVDAAVVVKLSARTVDKEAAQDALRMACPHLEGYYANKNNTRSEDLDAIRMAGRYVAEARGKDPNASVLYRTKDGTEITLTVDTIAAEVLYLGAMQDAFNSDPAIRMAAIQPLREAISYVPGNALYRRELARLYLNLDMREEGLAAALEAIALDPADVEAKRLLESIGPREEPAAPRSYANVGACLSGAGAALVVAAPFIAYAIENWWAVINVLFFGALPLLTVGRILRTLSANSGAFSTGRSGDVSDPA